MHNFLAFAEAHDEAVNVEEDGIFFASQLERIEWKVDHWKSTRKLHTMFSGRHNDVSMEDIIYKEFSVTEETYGIATSLYGICAKKSQSHVFRVDVDKIAADIRKDMHGNTRGKLYSLNYTFSATIKKMECGSTYIATLTEFSC